MSKYEIDVSYPIVPGTNPDDEINHPDAVGPGVDMGAPPEQPIAKGWNVDFLKELQPANLRGTVKGIHELMADNATRVSQHRDLSTGALGPAMGARGLTEARVPLAVHLAMEEKYGQNWYQDDELFERFLRDTSAGGTGYRVYDRGRK